MTRNLWHSCGRYRLADHFVGRQPVVRRIFARLRQLVRACGPVTVYAQKTRIVFQVRVRFTGAVTRQRSLEAGVWLKRRAAHPRLARLEVLGREYLHYFRFTDPAQLDRAFAALVKEAYRIGRQEQK